MKIMIVDDNPTIRLTIRRILAGRSASFYECSDGSEAVEAYDTIHPDWVLMDVRMKEMDGIRATREIRRIDPAARVVIVTQYSDTSVREGAQRAGAVAFVLKEDLVDLDRIIEGYRN